MAPLLPLLLPCHLYLSFTKTKAHTHVSTCSLMHVRVHTHTHTQTHTHILRHIHVHTHLHTTNHQSSPTRPRHSSTDVTISLHKGSHIPAPHMKVIRTTRVHHSSHYSLTSSAKLIHTLRTCNTTVVRP